jgi:hypothetical protein
MGDRCLSAPCLPLNITIVHGFSNSTTPGHTIIPTGSPYPKPFHRDVWSPYLKPLLPLCKGSVQEILLTISEMMCDLL